MDRVQQLELGILRRMKAPYLFAVLSALLFLFDGSVQVFDLSIMVGSAVGVSEIFRVIYNPREIKFSQILLVSILLASCLGTFAFMAGQGTIYAAKYQYWFDNGLTYTQNGLSLALALDFFAVTVLYVASQFELPIELERLNTCTRGTDAKRIVWIGTFLIAVAIATGKIGYMGIVSAKGENISPLAAIAILMLPGLVSLAFAIMVNCSERHEKYIYAIALLFLAAVLMLVQRRALLYTFLLCAIIWRFRNPITRARDYVKDLLFASTGVIVVYVGFYAFFALRYAVEFLGTGVGLRHQIALAISTVGGGGFEVLQARLGDNVDSRTMTLGYFAGLVDAPRSHLPTFGSELVLAVKQTIPAALMPGKKVVGMSEDIVHPLVGIPVFDGPNSILTAGYSDFGVVGVVLYPVCVIGLLVVYYKMVCVLMSNATIRVYILLLLIFMLLGIGVESALGSVFVTLRDLLLVAILMALVLKLPNVRQVVRFLSFSSTKHL